MQIGRLPRVRLANLPTPLEDMPNLSRVLGGPRVLIKRDDYTGLAFGGNKVRKLEFLMAEAKARKADVVITSGGLQSNHARLTASAARKLGMKVVLVLHGEEPRDYDGNLLLDFILGADIRFLRSKGDEPIKVMESMAEELKRQGHNPYIIPMSGSTGLGAVGYVNASLEILTQSNEIGLNINYIIHASGSGGTQAGLILGNKALNTGIKVLGISIGSSKVWLAKRIADVANSSAELLGLNLSVSPSEVAVIDDYVEGGGEASMKDVVDAIKLVAKTEGIILDPIYTGRAMAALIDLIKRRYFDKEENIVFIHTGGTPAIFACKEMMKT